jgi:phospholipid-translocating ATPase
MFAHQGWRTLALAYKYISEQEYARIDEMIKNSYNDILHRKEMLAKCYEEVEDGLDLLGATAVEDKLQEDVSDTLEKLRKGGIKIWVLTGDKRETAINISNSCKHFSDSMIKLMLTDIKQPAQIKSRLEHFIKM